jgi:hypothetical protein
MTSAEALTLEEFTRPEDLPGWKVDDSLFSNKN